MKTKLTFVLILSALALGLKPAPTSAAPQQCAAFCAIVRCIGGQICGPFTNASGQTVCGCHDPR